MVAPSCNVGVNVKNGTDAGSRGKNQLYTVSTVHSVCGQLIVEMQSKVKASLIALPDRAYLD